MRRVAVIMPALDEEAATDETMAALAASTRLPDEIIVADGMSADRTVEQALAWRARGLNVTVVPNPGIFPGAGRNAGAAATECEILLFCDFGNRVEPDWVAAMAAPFERDEAVEFVTGLCYAWITNEFQRCIACINCPQFLAYERATPEERRARMAPMAGGGSMGCTRRCWQRAGGFPDWLRTAEDKLFARKMALLGAPTARAWDAAVRRHLRADARQILRQYFNYARGEGQTQLLNRVLFKLAAVYGGLTALLALAPVSAAFPAAALALFAAYAQLAAIRKLRRHDPGLRRPIHLLYALQILLARDLGTIAGSVAGWRDWLLVPLYREKLRAYLLPP